MPTAEHLISADDSGRLVFVYSDELAFLSDLGPSQIKRASHVEPNDNGTWNSDMKPSGGPVLGPFNCRQAALDAEVRWLQENVL